ncbi:Alpha/Beta hydrolase protein [Xylariales sp. PMI_506]|nr:Alpha/Beta hydrolase protein [Xylariales sp. PMI_506]
MGEKEELTRAAPCSAGTPSPPHWASSARATSWRPQKIAVALAVLSCLAILHLPRLLSFGGRAFLGHRASCGGARGRDDGSVTYPGERIAWAPCGEIGGKPLECSALKVPVDQFNATASSSSPGGLTFELPLIRLRGGPGATQNLLTNPGGPGASGVDFLRVAGAELSASVGDGFHLLSFDPRGVGGSRPRPECYPAADDHDDHGGRGRGPADAARAAHPLAHDGQRPEDAGEVRAWAANFAKVCAEGGGGSSGGEYARFLNTPQTAADMNSILDAVGQADMVYWGFSYGTLLGQTYAALFPERSRRIIIDGVVNAHEWYDSRLNEQSLEDAERVFAGFTDECVAAGEERCALAGSGKTGAGLRAELLDLVAGLRVQPVDVYVSREQHGVITAEQVLLNAIFVALYTPQSWPALADRLAELLAGNATGFFLQYGLQKSLVEILGDVNTFIKMNDGTSGPDGWPAGRDAFLDIMEPYWASSLFGQSQGRVYYLKQQWVIPRTHNFSFADAAGASGDDPGAIKTAHPLLILNTSYDPVCPLSSAKVARELFEGSQIVELKAYGHCSAVLPSACIDRHVRAYLYNGTVPEKHTVCEADGIYFPPPARESEEQVSGVYGVRTEVDGNKYHALNELNQMRIMGLY